MQHTQPTDPRNDHGNDDRRPETLAAERERPQGAPGHPHRLGRTVVRRRHRAGHPGGHRDAHRRPGDPATAGIALQAVDLFAIWPMFVASLVCLGSGVLLGVGSRYGLVRYWWVAVKFAINVLMSILIFFALRPGVGEAAGVGERLLAGDPTAVVPDGLIYPVVVAPTLLLIAYVLSTVKPWGRTRRPTPPAAAIPARAERARAPIGARS
ncbi:hypothetical protein ACVGOW_04090 [Pseudonocardia saturnea]